MPQKYIATIGSNAYAVPDDDLDQIDLIAGEGGTYHLIKNGKSYRCEVRSVDLASKQVKVAVNGKLYSVALGDRIDQLVKELGFATADTQVSKDVIAPMPGLVLDIMVEVGDTVEAGTPLLILEAMKMENVLKSEGEGTIVDISVSKGDAVEKRQLLIHVE